MTVLPGSPQSSFLVSETTGLVGTLTWRLLDSTGGAIITAGTASITEGPSGTYRRDYTAPSTLGLYQPIWNDGTDYPDTPLVVSRSGFGSSGFITTQDLSDVLGRDVTSDNGAEIAVQSACDVCRVVAEQTFDEVVGDTLTLDGTGTDCLLLPQLPVNAAGTVLVNGTAVTDYVLADNGRLIRGSANSCWSTGAFWPLGRQNVTVTYDHGYAGGTIPADVRMVALSVASRLVIQGVASREQVGDVQVQYATAATDLTNGEQRILAKYRPIR